MPNFPDTIVVNGREFTLIKESKTISGENPKKFYQDEKKNIYIVKIEKERKIADIFKNSLSTLPAEDEPYTNILKKHLDTLRDTSTAISVIASYIAKAIFPTLVVPENFLARLKDGTPIILSKFLPQLDEFLSKTSVVTLFKPTKSTNWETLPSRSNLSLNMKQVNILGKIYYISLLIGHWDAINNIDLKNSGSITIKKEIKPCIVDWGNCIGIGFGGLSKDITAFQNPEFKDLKLSPEMNSVIGFSGTVPFDRIVYPKLPRQVVSDLFDLTTDDDIGKEMLKGFKEAHAEARINLPALSIIKMITKVLGEKDEYQFKYIFDPEFFGKLRHSSNDKEPGLKKIFLGRFKSLDEIINKIDTGKKMIVIAEEQLEKIIASQRIKILPKTKQIIA